MPKPKQIKAGSMLTIRRRPGCPLMIVNGEVFAPTIKGLNDRQDWMDHVGMSFPINAHFLATGNEIHDTHEIETNFGHAKETITETWVQVIFSESMFYVPKTLVRVIKI